MNVVKERPSEPAVPARVDHHNQSAGDPALSARRALRQRGGNRDARDRQAKALEIVQLDGLRETYEELRRRFGGLTRRTAEDYYEIGLLVREASQKAVEKHVCHSTGNILSAWNDALGLRPRTLYTCAAVAEAYSREELHDLISLPGITWAHIDALKDLGGQGERTRLAKMASENGWSYREVLAEMVPDRRPKPRGPGRSPSVPKSVRQGLDRVAKAAPAFVRQVRECWFCESSFDLVEELHAMLVDDISGDTAEKVTAALDAFEKLGEAVPGIVSGLRQAKMHVADVLERREKAAQTEDAEGIDDALDDDEDVSDAEPEDDDSEEIASDDDGDDKALFVGAIGKEDIDD